MAESLGSAADNPFENTGEDYALPTDIIDIQHNLGIRALDAAEKIKSDELGPSSMLWHYAGDWRLGFTGLSAGLLQIMHPGVGAGVTEHSTFFDEPWQRIERSLPEIIGVIYDENPEQTGHKIRNYHKNIQGRDEKGRLYRALDSETFWWPHATFHYAVEQIADRFSRRTLTLEQREHLYEESKIWYSRYGVSAKAQPETYAQFREKWDDICTNVLEMTPAAERAITLARQHNVNRIPLIKEELWPLVRLPASDKIRQLTFGGLPKIVQERFGLTPSLRDKIEIAGMEQWVQNTWHFLPRELRYHPRALAAQDRVRKNIY